MVRRTSPTLLLYSLRPEEPAIAPPSTIAATSPWTEPTRPSRVAPPHHLASGRSSGAQGTQIATSSGLPRWAPTLNATTPVSFVAARRPTSLSYPHPRRHIRWAPLDCWFRSYQTQPTSATISLAVAMPPQPPWAR
jgi:hypothetical protein